ncbi:carbamoyltransferase [Nocardiopsis mwathae]|uniref:Carbamoyltransferase n=1 Tax=Nocardiopsis mwathae TaxID=1472723 RepID=A0A7X0D8U5_9ACTN|nr:carbamoyltransferase C-terminal domain-containing protein [Nocardiopsis mwathae]MBB6175131.1 carbamoyltransferase [Nocardiopsis mwathae]
MNGRSGWVAGVNHGAHDASCALLHHGELVVAVEQERLSRRKRAVDQSPARALRYCLDFAGIDLTEVDCLALGSDHDGLAAWLGVEGEERERALPYDRPGWLFPDEVFHGARPRAVRAVPHHLAHAASGYWPSGFGECAVLVIDAMGENTGTSIAVARDGGVEILESYGVETSLGFFYEAASEFAGLGRQDGGKLMGLASYGRPVHPAALAYRDGAIVWDGVPESTRRGRALIEERSEELQRYFADHTYPYSRRRGESVMAYADFAASAQAALEETILGLARRARELTGLNRLAVAGGVGLNCTANGRLADSGIFDEVYVQPMAHDAGVALGAALAVAAEHRPGLQGVSRMSHAYWGPDLTAEDTAAAFAAAGVRAERFGLEELLPRVVRILTAGGIVAWGQGRAEVGPRALGARSLLGDPRDRETLTRLNLAKNREMWRPLAPSVQEERFAEFFEGTPNAFMIVAARVREEARRRIPAVVHVDHSARPQAVRREDNPAYHALLSSFDAQTGVPVLVNTSLNVAEEPMASSADDILSTYLKSGADAVVIGDHLAVRD